MGTCTGIQREHVKSVLLSPLVSSYTNDPSNVCLLYVPGPSESRDIAELVEAAGGIYIEAPVLGSQPEAAAGKLLVMVGARTSPETSLAWPVLTALGLSPQYIGDVGTAAAVKLSLNQLIASLTVSSCELFHFNCFKASGFSRFGYSWSGGFRVSVLSD